MSEPINVVERDLQGTYSILIVKKEDNSYVHYVSDLIFSDTQEQAHQRGRDQVHLMTLTKDIEKVVMDQ